MKLLDIALKDLVRSFRSAFLLVMMLVVPMLITGLIYFAFGNISAGGLNMAPVRVQVVNLDQPGNQSFVSSGPLAAGQLLVDYLRSGHMTSIMQVKSAQSEADARAAVDRREADIAIIIPPDFSTAVLGNQAQATVTLYSDPAASIGPGIVKTVVGRFIDGFSGAKIAVQVATHQMLARGVAASEANGEISQDIVQRYTAWLKAADIASGATLAMRSPSSNPQPESAQSSMIGSVMAGMLIFFVFFTGASCALSIVREDEEGTLARLFTTPTSRASILGGKFVGGALTLIVQIVLLVTASVLLFGVSWGEPLATALVMATTVVAASGFGVLLMSFVKSTRQAGAVSGGVMTLTGMVGGLFFFSFNTPQALDTLSLAVPQGWALRGLKLAQAGGGLGDVFVPALVLLAMGAVFFVAGTFVLRRRFS